jgi:hypothetical protein
MQIEIGELKPKKVVSVEVQEKAKAVHEDLGASIIEKFDLGKFASLPIKVKSSVKFGSL